MNCLLNKFFRNPKGSLVILFFLLLLDASYVQAQIVVNKTEGCFPFEVEFTHNFGNVTNPKWDFGDDSFSEVDFPNHTYVKKGPFTVKFTADGGISDQIVINSYAKPNVDFIATTPTKGCVPFTVSFENKTVGDGGSNIVKLEWSFGDGGTNNTDEKPSNKYILVNNFPVSLIATDEHGCAAQKVIENMVLASKPPKVSFTTTPNPPASCKPPLKVTFKNTSKTNSPTGAPLTYFWDFGNTETSTLENPPAVNYTEEKIYFAILKATDDAGCVDSTTPKKITVQNPIASFEIENAISDTVCNDVTFINTSQGGAVTYIEFGDGGNGVFDVNNKARHLYEPGTYTVKVKTVSGTCSNEITKQIVILPIKVNFSASPLYTCSFPIDVQYTDLSEGAVSWKWTFTGGDIRTDQNPKVKYDIEDVDTFLHSLNSGEFFSTLTITNRYGCKDSVTKSLVKYAVPTARFMPDKVSGCIPLTVNFSDSSSSEEPVVNYEWIFGDGGKSNGTSNKATHVYNKPGDYYAKLVITNSLGCRDTSYGIHIRVGDKIVPNFEIVPPEICLGQSFQIKDLTPKPNNIDQIHFQIGKGHPIACPSEGVVNYTPDTLAGNYDIKMTVGWNGCISEVTKPAILKIKGPSAEFKANFDCAKPLEWNFTIQQKESDSWDIDFGDGTVITGSTDLTFTHSYPSSNDYTVKLTAKGSTGCQPSVFTGVVKVRDLKAVIATDSLGCTRVEHLFDASPSIGTSPIGKADGYIWDWGDSTQHIRTGKEKYSHIYTTGGPKVVTLVVKGVNGCYDTTQTTINIHDVKGNFDIVGKQPGCIPGLKITFNDKSLSDTTLVKWNWNFGDGNTSTEVSPTHTYNDYPINNEFFIVKLNLTDTLGCKGDVEKKVEVSKPEAEFTVDDSTGCTGKVINFSASFAGHKNYIWDFGDANVVDTSASKISHAYLNPGEYKVKLQVVDSVGCTETFVLMEKIKIQKTPEARIFSPMDTLSVLCYPIQVSFTDTSIIENFGSRKWDLDLDDPNDQTNPSKVVSKNYGKPRVYRISLTVKTTYGCSSTALDTLNVVGPIADFDFTPNLICKGQSVTFNIKDTTNVFTYKWDFGDGLEGGAISPITHKFNFHPPNGKANVSLIYWSKDSVCKASTTHIIDIHRVIADFKRNNELTAKDTAHCWGITDVFTDASVNANSWSWNFGDGTTFEGQFPPTHLYQNNGTFNVSLAISDTGTGCVDTIVKQMVIFPKVNAVARGGVACQGDSVQLMASGGSVYSWSPASSITDPSLPNPKAFPATTTIYTVTVANQFGCAESKTALAEIIEKPESTTITNTDLIIGEKDTLNVYQGKYHYYQWSPNQWINCLTCPVVIVQPLEPITYTVTITDSLGCFVVPKYFVYTPRKEASVDVPNTFTPNGDGANDVIYVKGWGIEKLLEFKIYNRWGQLVFETDNIDEGWDGKFRGVEQDVDTYVYYVKVKNYIKSEPSELQGYINLVR